MGEPSMLVFPTEAVFSSTNRTSLNSLSVSRRAALLCRLASDNCRFIMIMSRIFSSAEPDPQLTWTAMSYNDPYFPTVGHGRRYALNMECTPLENLDQYDCVVIVTDHSDYDYPRIVRESKLVVD